MIRPLAYFLSLLAVPVRVLVVALVGIQTLERCQLELEEHMK
jgi:hypothetical protein